MFKENVFDPYRILLDCLSLRYNQFLTYLLEIDGMYNPQQSLLVQALLNCFQEVYLSVAEPDVVGIPSVVSTESLAAFENSLYGNVSLGKLSLSEVSKMCAILLESLAVRFPELREELRPVSSQLQDIQPQIGTTSMSSMIARIRDHTASVAGCKSTEEEGHTADRYPILGGRPRAIYAQSMREKYKRLNQGILQTSSGNYIR